MASNGNGTSPTITNIKTFRLYSRKNSKLISEYSAAEGSIINAATTALIGGVSTGIPLAIGLRGNRYNNITSSVRNSYNNGNNTGSNNSGNNSGNDNE